MEQESQATNLHRVEDTTNENSLLFESDVEEEPATQQNPSQVSHVANVRIQNGIFLLIIIYLELKNLDLSTIQHKYDDLTKIILIIDKAANIRLDLSKSFPFDAPDISIELKEEEFYFTLMDLKLATFEDVMREYWHPSIKIVDIAEKSREYVKKHAILIEKVPFKMIRIMHGLLTLDKPVFKLF